MNRKNKLFLISNITISLLLATASNVFADEGISYFKNRPSDSPNGAFSARDLTTDQVGKVYGTHSYYEALALRVWKLNDKTNQYEEITEADLNNSQKIQLEPGMILDLPISETARLTPNLLSENSNARYKWADIDAGDREINATDVHIRWWKLTLKNNSNLTQCTLWGENISLAGDPNQVWSNLQEAAERAGKSVFVDNDLSKLQTDANTPWQECFTVEEILPVENKDFITPEGLKPIKPIEIPKLGPRQRIGFSVIAESKYGFPKEGFQAYVWDISQVWRQVKPAKTLSSPEIEGPKAIFPVREDAGLRPTTNDDMALPIKAHSIIATPEIKINTRPVIEPEINIYDYDLYKQGIRDALNNPDHLTNNNFIQENKTDRRFYVNNDYIVVIDLPAVNGSIRSLTRKELMSDDSVVVWNLYRIRSPLTHYDRKVHDPVNDGEGRTLWDTRAEANPNLFIKMSHSLAESDLRNPGQNTMIKVIWKDNVDINDPKDTDEIVGIVFNTQETNAAFASEQTAADLAINPELSQQTFRATVSVRYDPDI